MGRKRPRRPRRGRLRKALTAAALIPLQPAMMVLLKARKLPVSLNPRKNAMTIYERVLKKGKKFEGVEPVLTTTIITAVIAFFRDLAKRKREGKLPPGSDLEKVGAAADRVEKNVEEKVRDEGKFRIGDFLTKNIIWIAAGAGLLIFFVMRKK